jgi:hypothetical protein
VASHTRIGRYLLGVKCGSVARVAATNQRVEIFFDDVSVAGNTVAVGTALIGPGEGLPIVERSTGGPFTPMPVPHIFAGQLNGVSAASPGHASAVGDSYAAMAGPISVRLE